MNRVRRFQQEARAASALNHPNILTIHEIGSENSTYFIATEYIEPRTRRQHGEGNHPDRVRSMLLYRQRFRGGGLLDKQ